MTWDAMVTVGRIVRPHGIRGAVVVEPETDFAAERFQAGAELQRLHQGAPETVRVEESREFRGRWIVRLSGIGSMTDAEALRGQELRVRPDELHALPANAHYVHDLEGCEVVTVAGEPVGKVSRVEFGTGTPVLVVGGESGAEVLVPLAESICRTIDPAAGRIVIDPPAGLVDLNRVGRR